MKIKVIDWFYWKIRTIKNFFLVKKYPWLRCRNVWTGKLLDYEFTWLDDMPMGWRKAFGMDIVKELDEALGDYRTEYMITQIKEKYRYFKMV